MSEVERTDESYVSLRLQVIAAGKVAAKELIKIAEEPIIDRRLEDDNSTGDGLSADKLTRAAAAKKAAIIDAFDILQRCEEEDNNIKASEGAAPPPSSWAEERAKSRKPNRS